MSVRVDDETLRFLKAHQVNVSEVARSALVQEARRQRALMGLTRLKKWAAPAGEERTTESIRRHRDER